MYKTSNGVISSYVGGSQISIVLFVTNEDGKSVIRTIFPQETEGSTWEKLEYEIPKKRYRQNAKCMVFIIVAKIR
jgi:hypothetical protein